MLLMRDESTIYSRLINICLITFLIPIVAQIAKILSLYITEISLFKKNTSNTYKIKAAITYRNNLYYSSDIPFSFKAVMADLYNIIIKDPKANNLYNVVSICIGNGHKTMKFIMFKKEGQFYNVNDKIKLSLVKKQWTSEKQSELNNFFEQEFEICSRHNNINDVFDYINDVTSKYEEFIRSSITSQRVFVLSNFTDINGRPKATFDEIQFDTSKTFDNMFFGEKERLIQALNNFENKKDRYTRLGIPHTLGLMFHGEPGTGKTSAIKAIAKYTNRHIIMLPMKLINNINKLKSILFSDTINEIFIPMNKRIYVFEEIDCSQWANIVKTRALENTNTQQSTNDNEALKLVTKVIQSVAPSDTKDSFDITLGDFLEILDGIIEIPGRMIIMTSNHPDRIDPALLRPGRIDINIQFKKMTRRDIASLFKLWFSKELPQKILDKMKDYTFTQAQIGNIFANNNIDAIYKQLTN